MRAFLYVSQLVVSVTLTATAALSFAHAGEKEGGEVIQFNPTKKRCSTLMVGTADKRGELVPFKPPAKSNKDASQPTWSLPAVVPSRPSQTWVWRCHSVPVDPTVTPDTYFNLTMTFSQTKPPEGSLYFYFLKGKPTQITIPIQNILTDAQGFGVTGVDPQLRKINLEIFDEKSEAQSILIYDSSLMSILCGPREPLQFSY